MEAIPLFLASAGKAILLGAVMDADGSTMSAMTGDGSTMEAPLAEVPDVPGDVPVAPVAPVAPVVPVAEPTGEIQVGQSEVGTTQTTGETGDTGDTGDTASADTGDADAGQASQAGEGDGNATSTSTSTAGEAVNISKDVPKVETVVNAKVNDAKASFASEQKPFMDEQTRMMYVDKKIHDFFSGGIAPSDITNVVKESYTVLREFDKLNEGS